jgi:hypothetical protein
MHLAMILSRPSSFTSFFLVFRYKANTPCFSPKNKSSIDKFIVVFESPVIYCICVLLMQIPSAAFTIQKIRTMRIICVTLLLLLKLVQDHVYA